MLDDDGHKELTGDNVDKKYHYRKVGNKEDGSRDHKFIKPGIQRFYVLFKQELDTRDMYNRKSLVLEEAYCDGDLMYKR
jgi:hypothetical protein